MAPRRAGPFAARGPVARLLIAAAACGAAVACGDVETTATIDDAGNRGPDGGGGGGATSDAAPVDPDAAGDVCATWDPALPFEPCDIPAGLRGGDLVFLQAGTYTYDTETDALTSPGGTAVAHASMTLEIDGREVRLISAQRLVIAGAATWRVTGDSPLVVIAWNAIEVAGTINASSKAGHGPGANPPECANAQTGGAGSSTMNGQGGGGGGGFGGRGGEGGSGGGEANEGNGGSFIGGLAPLRGGCGGGDATGRTGSTARGGVGGGALALSARLDIQLTGIINAGGAGGGGGEGGGGAGGGSGGMLWLDAPSVALADTAVLAASGGGGGSGATAFSEGDDGEGARPDGERAHGAPGDIVPDGRVATPSSSAGGGGGGGGAGVIRVDGELDAPTGATIVPFPEG